MRELGVDARFDALLGMLDAPAAPNPAFVETSMAELLPHVRRARREDSSSIGKLRREVAVAGTSIRGWKPIPSPRLVLVGLLMLAAILVAMTAVLIGSARRLPAPYGLAANGELAYVAAGHIFLANATGGRARQITFDAGTQVDPAFSRDGTRIAYRRFAAPDADVADAVVMNADGSDAVVVARSMKGLSHMAWSPDSRTIAFSGSIRGGPGEGWLVPADGSDRPKSFVSLPGAWDPVWSPDGTQLAIGADPGQLWVVGRDGSNARRVSHGTYDEVGQRDAIAAWSPDGTSIAFTAGTPMATQLYLVGLDGARERQISHGVVFAMNASWSPDGSQLVYMRAGDGSGPVPVLADRTGRVIRDLPGQYSFYTPLWSPDGSKIMVLDEWPGPDNNADGPAVLVIIDVAGTAPPVVLPAPADIANNLPDAAASWQRLAP